jgi:hypothetical protein
MAPSNSIEQESEPRVARQEKTRTLRQVRTLGDILAVRFARKKCPFGGEKLAFFNQENRRG